MAGLPPNVAMELFRHDVTNACLCAATARVTPVIFQVITVVKRDLLAGCDVPVGDDPDPLEPELTEADVARDPPSPLISEKMGKRLGLLALALVALAIILLA